MSILSGIGNTPLVELTNINTNPDLKILGKLEGNNPGGSVKDRPAYYMIKKAEETGELTKDKIILEPTSGNTGIALAMIGAAKGYKVKLCMPACVSTERQRVLEAYGAEVVLTPANEATDGAIRKAHQMHDDNPEKYYMPNQFENESNIMSHYETTGPEIFEQTNGEIDVFVAGIGGLGCLLSEILVRSGIGRIYICDNGIVDEPDLNRQLFYTQKDIGRNKIDVASELLSKIHDYSEIVPLSNDIMADDFSLPDDINGVSDCLDNFESRFSLWNTLKEDLFYVHAGVEENFGQVLTLKKGISSELSDVFANYNNSERTIPVYAGSASVVSSLASTEVINNLFHEPKLLNTLLIIDLSDVSFDKINIS